MSHFSTWFIFQSKCLYFVKRRRMESCWRLIQRSKFVKSSTFHGKGQSGLISKLPLTFLCVSMQKFADFFKSCKEKFLNGHAILSTVFYWRWKSALNTFLTGDGQNTPCSFKAQHIQWPWFMFAFHRTNALYTFCNK